VKEAKNPKVINRRSYYKNWKYRCHQRKELDPRDFTKIIDDCLSLCFREVPDWLQPLLLLLLK